MNPNMVVFANHDQEAGHSHSQAYDHSNGMEALNDDLLLCILERVPWIWAVCCKSVCKRWYFLMSDPQYKKCSPCTVIYRLEFDKSPIYYPSNYGGEYYPFTENLQSKDRGLDLSFLPCYNYSNPLDPIFVNIVTSYKNLLVLSPTAIDDTIMSEYYICDLYRRQYIKLPAALTMHHCPYAAFGFTVMETTCATLPSLLNYRLVCVQQKFLGSEWHLVMEIFSSESKKWEMIVLGGLKEKVFDFKGCEKLSAVALNHKLYWVDEKYVMEYDPFYAKCEYKLFEVPNSKDAMDVTHCLGTYEGSLWLSQVEHTALHYTLNVWKLKDIWSLEHRICLPGLRLCGPTWSLGEFILPKLEVLAFHPFDPTTLLLSCEDQLFRCNLKRGTLREIFTINHYGVKIEKNVFFLFQSSDSVILL